MRFKKFWMFFVMSLIFVVSLSPGNEENTVKVDKLFEKFDSTHTQGASVAIIKDDKIVYKKAYGMASLELGVPNTTQTVFRLGSISKQFTAACIAMLAMEGKLSLDDSVTDFFPELPKKVYGPVRIKDMIHHTSGIRDSEALYPVMNMEYSQWFTHDMLLELLARQKSLDFTPGEEFEYSNSAYTLLAMIVQRVSKKSFHEFVKERIFEPIGMSHTRIQTSYDTFIPKRAAGYALSPEGYGNWMTNNQLVGHDAVYSSVEDMYCWIQVFFSGSLGKDLIPMMTTRSLFNDGSPNNYTYGIVVDEYKGLKTYSHGGWYVGYLAFILIFPEQKFSVICLSNVIEGSPANACFRIAEIYLKDQLKASLKELRSRANPIDAGCMERLVGDYTGIDYGGKISLTVLDGALKPQAADWSFEPSPYADQEFINYDRRIRLRVLSGQKEEEEVVWANLTSMGSAGRYKKQKENAMAEDELIEYAGGFKSDELNAEALIRIEEGRLSLEVGRLKGNLSSFGKDNFNAGWGLVKFHRDTTGKISGFGLSQYGYRGVIFSKSE
ncbi:MAG: serine hydrolase [Candidatus Aminicenantes bacterium]|nr:serine hydrolase [Candidatus Aminicenantes bacterium]